MIACGGKEAKNLFDLHIFDFSRKKARKAGKILEKEKPGATLFTPLRLGVGIGGRKTGISGRGRERGRQRAFLELRLSAFALTFLFLRFHAENLKIEKDPECLSR